MTRYKNIEEICNSLKLKLQELRPLLPAHFVKEIRKTLPDVSKTQIHNAFGTRAVKLNVLQKIYNTAVSIAYENKVSIDKADEAFEELVGSLQDQ